MNEPRFELVKLFQVRDLPRSVQDAWGGQTDPDNWIEDHVVHERPGEGSAESQELDDWLLAHGAERGETVFIKMDWRACPK